MEQVHFTSIGRTRVANREVVLAIGNRDLADAACLVGTVARIDGTYYVVYRIAPSGKRISAGQALMMSVGKSSQVRPRTAQIHCTTTVEPIQNFQLLRLSRRD